VLLGDSLWSLPVSQTLHPSQIRNDDTHPKKNPTQTKALVYSICYVLYVAVSFQCKEIIKTNILKPKEVSMVHK